MNEEDARAEFCRLRWPDTNGAPVCPICGGMKHYNVRRHSRYRCANQACQHTFSPTSGTIFRSKKIPYSKMMLIINDLTTAKREWKTTAVLAEEFDVAQKTAWTFHSRVRKMMASGRVPERV